MRSLRAPLSPDADVSGYTVTFALLGGLSAWILRLIIGSWLVSYACRSGAPGTIALYSVAAVFLAIAAAALVLSMRLFGPGRQMDWEEGELPGVTYIGILGIMLNAISLIAILTEVASIPFINPCEPT
ncbi:MAG: hypothetical protein ACRDZO_11630 [Egibacteraceae bacterium]